MGKTSYTYDKQGRVIESVTRRLSCKALVKRFTYHGSTGQLATFTSSDAPTLVWEYTYDGIGRRVAKTCYNTTTGDILTKTIFTHVGDQLVAEHHLTSSTGDDVVGRVWITDPATGDIIGQINHTTNTPADPGSNGDPATWSQTQVDATFYAMVADLAGAPQELINPHTGAIAGKATHTLYGRRKWDGETTPLLFAGQYEDTETGLVYNRYRYYNPHTATYTTQDPLGVGPNPATAQGYVTNPTTWTDKQGLAAHPRLKQERDALGRFVDGNGGSNIGKEAVDAYVQKLKGEGWSVQREVKLSVGDEYTMVDVVGKRNVNGVEEIVANEVKRDSGSLTPNQREVYKTLTAGGTAEFSGANASKLDIAGKTISGDDSWKGIRAITQDDGSFVFKEFNPFKN